VIYLDTSVVLAQLFADDRCPPEGIWKETPASSRLSEVEVWTRVHARNLGTSQGDAVRSLLRRVAFIEFIRPVLQRATEPFPVPVRTLDALHPASMEFLRYQDRTLTLASYDRRLLGAARRLGVPSLDL